MASFLMETVVVSFTLGGIVGATIAMLLKPGKHEFAKDALVYANKNERFKIRRY